MEEYYKITIWKPLEIGHSNITVESLVDNSDGLTIQLLDLKTKNTIQVVFDYFVAYTNTPERYLLKIWIETERSLLGNTFYKVENSPYIKYLADMGMGFNPEVNRMTHYSIYTLNSCIDVISDTDPIVQVLNDGSE